MNKYNPQIHHRKSIRLKGYDYAQEGLYFVTICCQDRAHLFGNIMNGKMILNDYGKIATEQWESTERIRKNCALHEFIIMPNHIHGIVEILFKIENVNVKIGKFQSPSHSIGSIIRGFKIATIKKIKDFIQNHGRGELQFASGKFTSGNPTPGKSTPRKPAPHPTPTEKIIQLNFKIWQRNYWEHIIRDEKSFQRISKYIINNPLQWQEDKFFDMQ